MSERVFLAHFESAEALLAAARAARGAGLGLHEAWTPVPTPELDSLLDARPSRLGWIAFAVALIGFGGAFALQRYAALASWPIGDVAPSALMHVPVALACAAISAAACVALALFVSLSRTRSAGMPAIHGAFVLALSLRGSRFDRDEAIRVLSTHGATATQYAEVPR